MKEKYESMLNEEESKLKDARSFNNNILKEKEEMIRKEIESSMEVTKMENIVTDLRH